MKNYVQRVIELFSSSIFDKEIIKEFHHWLVEPSHCEEKESALRTLWDETNESHNSHTRQALSALYKRVGVNDTVKTPKRLNLHFVKYAAAIAVLFASIFSTYHITRNKYVEGLMVEQFTPAGKTEWITLPDGSEVHTNSGTLLLYPKKFRGDTRSVYLIGEAYFKVKKNPDKPFIVRSTTMSVTALGTEFNIAAYPENDIIVATLVEGKVQVDCNEDKDSYILTSGDQVIYSKQTRHAVMAKADLEDVTAWEKGQLVFRGATMKDIMTTLERRSNILFQYNQSQFNNDKYNFHFRQQSSVSDIMDVLKMVVGGFEYKIEGDTCFIFGK